MSDQKKEPCEECEENHCDEGEGEEGVYGYLKQCGHCSFVNFQPCYCDCHDKEEVKSE